VRQQSVASDIRPVLEVGYPLRGLLTCAGCAMPMQPLTSADGRRCYRSPCGCRLLPIDADAVERSAYGAVERRGLLSHVGVPKDAWAALFAAVLVEVKIGAASDDVGFVWGT
jgi:hypothetical protein